MDKQSLQKRIYTILGATIVVIGIGSTPVVPAEMKFLYAYERPCIIPPPTAEELSDPTYTPIGEQPYEPSCTEGNVAIAVFKDNSNNEVYLEIPTETYRKMGQRGGFDFNPKRSEYQSIFETLSSLAEAAEPQVAGTPATFAAPSAATSHTFAYTSDGTGENRALMILGVSSSGNNTAWSTVTYNGDSMTQIVSIAGSYVGGGIMFYRAAPASGSNNFVISYGASRSTDATMFNLVNVAQSSPVDVSSNKSATAAASSDVTLTSTVDNDIVIGWTVMDGTASGQTNSDGTLIALNTTAGALSSEHISSYIVKTTAGSQTLNYSWTTSVNYDAFITSIKYVAPTAGGETATDPQSVIFGNTAVTGSSVIK